MADFQQSGVITTLHRLGAPGVERLERELLSYSRSRPIALVLPCLMSELRGDGLKGIVDILRGVRYLRQIVVSISGSEDRADYEEMRRFWDGVETIDGEPPSCSGTAARASRGSSSSCGKRDSIRERTARGAAPGSPTATCWPATSRA
jgi:hypothetical protein